MDLSIFSYSHVAMTSSFSLVAGQCQNNTSCKEKSVIIFYLIFKSCSSKSVFFIPEAMNFNNCPVSNEPTQHPVTVSPATHPIKASPTNYPITSVSEFIVLRAKSDLTAREILLSVAFSLRLIQAPSNSPVTPSPSTKPLTMVRELIYQKSTSISRAESLTAVSFLFGNI